MIKIVIINHTFQKENFYKRWKKLAESHNDLDVTLLAPTEWEWDGSKTLTFGHSKTLQGVILEEKNFRIHLIDTKLDRYGEWTSKKLEYELFDIKPDVVYFIGGHTATTLMQIIGIRNKFNLSNMKIIDFSMRGHSPTINFHKKEGKIKKVYHIAEQIIREGPRLKKLSKYCDAVFCHYPDAVEAFRHDGYNGPVYMQTQVGVDPDIFHPDPEAREKIRQKYMIGDSYLFGSASRFHYSKGLSEIISALPEEGNWKYLIMGWGRDDEVNTIKRQIDQRKLNDKIIMTGFIDNWADMAEHWNALDCAIHAPLTTPDWEETFSLALVQAMITGLPVIGSSSGSVPYQIGPKGIIIPEGNTEKMRTQMLQFLANPEEGEKVGNDMRQRALDCFSIYHLNELFYLTIKDIVDGVYDENKADMANFRTSNE